MVRLGAGGLDGRALTPEAMHAALQVLSKFRRLAESHRVDEIIAVATSATREAENGGEFLARDHAADRHPRRGSSPAPKKRGSSTWPRSTASACRARRPSSSTSAAAASRSRAAPAPNVELGRSFKLGVIRLTERFVKSDPLEPRDERKLVRHIDAEIGDYLDQIARAGFDRVIGTSGTILSLGAVARGRATARAPARRCATAASPPSSCAACARSSSALDLEKRLRVPGLEPRRADLAVAGAILLDTILRRLGADEITLCDLSLREGLVLDYIARHRKQIAQADRYPDVRRRSVVELAERCNYWPEHAQQVARLAVGALRSDARRPRPDRSRARVARVRRAPARRRRPHQLRAAPQALVLPDQERRPARLRAGRDRDDRARRALSPPGDAEAAARGLRRAAGASAGGRSGRSRRSCGWPRASTAATRRPSPGVELHDRGDDDLLQLRTTRRRGARALGGRRGTPRRSSG